MFKKFLLIKNEIWIFGISRQFSNNVSLPAEFEYNPSFSQDKQLLMQYAKTLSRPPLNLFSSTATNLQKPLSFYPKHLLEQCLLTYEIQLIKQNYTNYLRALADFDEIFYESNLEGNFYKIVMEFMEKFNQSPFKFKLFEPEKLIFNVHFITNQTVQGVFIERFLNFAKTDYTYTENSFAKIFQVSNKNAKKFNFSLRKKENLLHDSNINPENIEEIRKTYKIQEVLVRIQTNLKLNIYDKSEKNLVYGSQEEDLLETRLFRVENKHEKIKWHSNTKKYVITDIDNILEGNPYFR